jgi:hypothetical protein
MGVRTASTTKTSRSIVIRNNNTISFAKYRFPRKRGSAEIGPMTHRGAWIFSLNVALISLAAGCGGSSPVTTPIVCAPDGAAGAAAGVGGSDAGAAGADAGEAGSAAGAGGSDAGVADAPMDLAASPDVAPDAAADAPPDLVLDVLKLNTDALTDGPAPPGVVIGSTDFLGRPMATVDLGLLAEISTSMGIFVLGGVSFAGAIDVVAGYGVDHVYMKVGSVTPPWGVSPAPGLPFIVSFGGARVYEDDPQLPPAPAYAPARALYDAMTKVPTTVEREFTGVDYRTRVSPGGRVKCRITLDGNNAACYFTGVQSLHIF